MGRRSTFIPLHDSDGEPAPPLERSAQRLAPRPAPRRPPRFRSRPGALTWLIAVMLLAGSGVLLYPATAQWISALNQARLLNELDDLVAESDPGPEEQLASAKAYNAALTAGVGSGAELEAGSNVPTSRGAGSAGLGEGAPLQYSSILSPAPGGPMARVKIPNIGVDLPIYHGTDDETLLHGAGHLEGTHLPVGGTGTHAVVTAHRGLATAAMFTALDRVKADDTFTVEVFGEVLSYRVRDTRVVAPEETDSLRAAEGADLMTLVTCTPLGINSHRILVTGERVIPTPEADLDGAGSSSAAPGFPWWALGLLLACACAVSYLWIAGRGDAARRAGGPRERRAPAHRRSRRAPPGAGGRRGRRSRRRSRHGLAGNRRESSP